MKTSHHDENGSAVEVIGRLLLGDSQPMQRLRLLIARLAQSDAPVLIEGPTGSGKELVAEALHICSGRPGAFVAFNVCAIADGTFESAVFGHVRGAFTGAVQDTRGYLSEADRGTAFFDEISGLPVTAQVKLLRAVEVRSFRPVGARRDERSDFRLVAASNEDLGVLVREGRFRADLRHRLRALVIRVPALSDHLEDVPLLARHFAACAASEETVRFSEEAIGLLLNYSWPGNVRELRNVVEFAMRLAAKPMVGAAEVTEALNANALPVQSGDRELMRHHLVSLLADCGGDIAGVAARLELHPSNVYRRMRRLGISTPKRRHISPDGSGEARASAGVPPEVALFAIDSANSRSAHANIANLRAPTSD